MRGNEEYEKQHHACRIQNRWLAKTLSRPSNGFAAFDADHSVHR